MKKVIQQTNWIQKRSYCSAIFSVILLSLLFTTCTGDNLIEDPPPYNSFEYLTFGHFYGFCQGESCVEIFRIDAEDIYEDSLDNYPGNTLYDGSYQVLDRSLRTKIRDIAAQ